MTAIRSDLDTLATGIRREVDAAEADFQSAVTHAIRAGELLIEAKAQIPHGGWLPWLEANCPLGEREARNYMRLARNRQRVADSPSVRDAVAALAEPRELEPPPAPVVPPADTSEQTPADTQPAATEERLARLDPDLAERVRNGRATIEYAEDVTVKREVRLQVWADNVSAALRGADDAPVPDVLMGLVGYPVPERLAAKLTREDRDVLKVTLDVLADAAAKQEALNAWSAAVDGLTAALSWAQTWQPPDDIPERYVQPAEFVERARTLLGVAESWLTPKTDGYQDNERRRAAAP